MNSYGMSIAPLPAEPVEASIENEPTSPLSTKRRSSAKILPARNDHVFLDELNASFHNITISPEKPPKLVKPSHLMMDIANTPLLSTKNLESTDSGYLSGIGSHMASWDLNQKTSSSMATSTNHPNATLEDQFQESLDNSLFNQSAFNASADLFETSKTSTSENKLPEVCNIANPLKKNWLNRISKGSTPPLSPQSPLYKIRKELKFENGIHLVPICR